MQMRKLGLTSLLLICASVMGMIFITSQLTSAQNQPIPVPPPPDSTEDNDRNIIIIPTSIGSGGEDAASYLKPVFRVRRPITDYNVIYLNGGQGADFISFTTPEYLTSELGAQSAVTWGEIISSNERLPIQGLIIHRSALHMVDYDWVQAAYRRGVVITAIDFGWPEMPEMLGTIQCETAPNQAVNRAAHFFSTASYLALGDNPNDVQKVLNARFERCLVDDEVEEDQLSDQLLMVTEKAGQLKLETESDFLLFRHIVNSQLNDIETMRQEVVMYGKGN